MKPFPSESPEIAAIIIYFLISLSLPLFFHFSRLIEDTGIALWYSLLWMIAFWEITLDLRLMGVFLFSLLLFWRIIRAEHNPENRLYPFTVGFLLSLMALMWIPALFLAVFFLIIYFFTRDFRFRALLLFLIGLALPLLIGLQLIYLLGETNILRDFQFDLTPEFWNTTPWVLTGCLILLLFAWIDHITHLSIQNISKRHIYFLALIFFWNWVAVLAVYGGDKTSMLIVLTVPVSIFMTRYTRFLKIKTYREIVMWLWLLILGGYFFRDEILEIYTGLLGNVAF